MGQSAEMCNPLPQLSAPRVRMCPASCLQNTQFPKKYRLSHPIEAMDLFQVIGFSGRVFVKMAARLQLEDLSIRFCDASAAVFGMNFSVDAGFGCTAGY